MLLTKLNTSKGKYMVFVKFSRKSFIERLWCCLDPFMKVKGLPIHSLHRKLTTCKAIGKGLPADLCSDHAHYVTIDRNKNMAVEGWTVSHYYILVIREFIDFMSLFRHSVWLSFSVKQFPSAEFGICNI